MKKTSTPLFIDKEILIMKLICNEFTSREIAGILRVSTSTITRYRKQLLLKTGSRNMVGIVNSAVQKGIYKI